MAKAKDPSLVHRGAADGRRGTSKAPIFIAVLCALLLGLGLVAVRVRDEGDDRIPRVTVPGDSQPTDVTFAGASARCKDGTYQYQGGSNDSARELCRDHGGVEQEFD